MEITYNHEKKLCCIWLRNDEKENIELRNSLNPLYKKNKEKGYLTAVYESGTRDLYEATRDLLLHNRWRIAEMNAQKK